MNEYYGKKLAHSVIHNDNEFHFPIMKVLIIVNLYNLVSLITIIFTTSYFLGIFWLIFVRDIEEWHNMGPWSWDVYQGY